MKTFNEVKLGLTTATYGNSLGSNIGKDYEHLKYFLEKRMLSLDKALDSYKSNMDELNAAMLQKSHSLGASHVATIDEKDKEIKNISSQFEALKKLTDKKINSIENAVSQISKSGTEDIAGFVKKINDDLAAAKAETARITQDYEKLNAKYETLKQESGVRKTQIKELTKEKNAIVKEATRKLEEMQKNLEFYYEEYAKLSLAHNDLIQKGKDISHHLPLGPGAIPRKPKDYGKLGAEDLQPEHVKNYGTFDLMEYLKVEYEKEVKGKLK